MGQLLNGLVHYFFFFFEPFPKIETFPIGHLKFPSITVCPPKGSYTNLNFDLVNLEKNVTKFTEIDRLQLQHLAKQLISDDEFATIVEKESKLKMKNKYLSWYNGYTKLEFYHVIEYTFHITTTENEGEIESPDYEADYDED